MRSVGSMRVMAPPVSPSAIVEAHEAFHNPFQCQGIKPVLLLEDACGESLRRLTLDDRYGGLRDDRPGIQLGYDKMHRAARHFDAGSDHALMDLRSFEVRQQGGVDVDHAPLPSPHEPIAQNA